MTVAKNAFEGTPILDRYPPSGINILIVGAGLGGLAFAIEAHRKGHDVQIIDRRAHFNDYGDFIAIQHSALRTPKNWPGFLEVCRNSRMPQVGEMRNHKDEYLGFVSFGLSTTRSDFHHILYQYAVHLGIDIQPDTRVMEYFEDADRGGVILENGARLTADIVVAADGIGSRAATLIKGKRDQPTSSGYAVLRATYPVEIALQNPLLKRYESEQGSSTGVVGPGAHVVTGSSGNSVTWMLTHKDLDPNGKDRAPPTDPKEALQYVHGWTPWLLELIKTTPEMGAVDYKILWRDPDPRWASEHSRVVQIGDAAHSFIPTSASGATMAIEDGYSLASCLQLGGKQKLALAVKVHNKLRFERVTCAQKMGFKNRQTYHETTIEPAKEGTHPEFPMVKAWVHKHNPEQYAYEMYGKCVNHVLTGSPFENTNYPPGHNFKIWTTKEFDEVSARGDTVVDDGDWS